MALKSAEKIKLGLEDIYASLADNKTERGMRAAVQKLNEVVGDLNRIYGRAVDIAITSDGDDAGVSEFVTAEASISVGTVYRITSTTEDFTDNAMGTAKGSAVANGDIYVVSGADAVSFLGNNSGGVAFDMAGETVSDFVSIGS